jgi:hypothetical protein
MYNISCSIIIELYLPLKLTAKDKVVYAIVHLVNTYISSILHKRRIENGPKNNEQVVTQNRS